jgi:hypothetical protein
MRCMKKGTKLNVVNAVDYNVMNAVDFEARQRERGSVGIKQRKLIVMDKDARLLHFLSELRALGRRLCLKMKGY